MKKKYVKHQFFRFYYILSPFNNLQFNTGHLECQICALILPPLQVSSFPGFMFMLHEHVGSHDL